MTDGEVVRVLPEGNEFGADPCLHPGVHLIARVGQFLRRLEITLRSRRVESLRIGVGSQGEQTSHETDQVIHLMIHPPRDLVGDVGKAGRCALEEELVVHTLDGSVVHLAVHAFLLPSLEPYLEHVLVERISHGPETNLLIGETRLLSGIPHIERIKTIARFDLLHQFVHPLGLVRVLFLARGAGQIPIFDLNRGKFRKYSIVPRPTEIRRPTVVDVHTPERYAAGGLERFEQPRSEIVRLVQERLVSRPVVRAEESTEGSNGRLEDRDRLVDVIVIQVIAHPIPCLGKFFLHPHEPQRIETIDQGRTHTPPVAV
mmetsp:Transcript_52166/g.156563  ORF Transcript_52166/g.156563 Transcript_52166/m.156563 type:complete len:315 (-) Transcript_52166:338-1282(-)